MWLMMSSTLVFAIVVVGGVTRLTESGLSITEWRPITGVLPPLSEAEWEAEFDKYKQTPEFKKLKSGATLSDFKFIFFMEWSHRLLGRLLGVAFVGPLVYFGIRRKISRAQFAQLFGLGTLIGAQGALGWYMVQSGLDEALMEEPGAVPRVSQYRLAAHLGMALALYAGMFSTGLGIIKDWKFSRGGKWSGSEAVKKFTRVLEKPRVKMFKRQAWALTGLVLLTALSGAFVAGLDAGLVYNEFPLMGGRLMPPADELLSPSYAKSADKSDLWWRNIFENPTTVQFDHRVLATTTYISTLLLWASSCRPALRAVLPPLTRTAMTAAFAMANVQVLLGISTLLYLVPVPLAAAHQAGSVMLLSAMLHVLVTLRKPGHAARLWRQMLARAKQGSTAATGTKQGI
ncbi:Electron transfer protein 1, mitochondrial [Termitomyces sp. J132]|nr:Electron transfer protein 1, mitochondrial [Termitomyces sp. J132]